MTVWASACLFPREVHSRFLLRRSISGIYHQRHTKLLIMAGIVTGIWAINGTNSHSIEEPVIY
ncbi:hypothetical protein Syun_007437 [Stephania yunnanensis]|uniref:Uncharacterized protein n=1 Tax=Stephania yunnanensis TaxID=152371 RepID=A0AAP0Q2D7_9MAGN